VKTVQLLKHFLITLYIIESVIRSTCAVGSSKTTILLFLIIARAKLRSYSYPEEKMFDLINKVSNFFSKSYTFSSSSHAFNASQIFFKNIKEIYKLNINSV
jgi:hypothetical protein